MTLDDAIWSYAEEFSDTILSNASARSVTPVIEEIAEKMTFEMYKRDRRKVMDKLGVIMMLKIADGKITQAKWDKIQNQNKK